MFLRVLMTEMTSILTQVLGSNTVKDKYDSIFCFQFYIDSNVFKGADYENDIYFDPGSTFKFR